MMLDADSAEDGLRGPMGWMSRVTERTVYPPLSGIGRISLKIATAVAERACREGLADEPPQADPEAWIESLMYDPTY